ncbi:MAG TPA: GspH/FimT family pseudopilin [Steroidobacteraceae bacterium]|jgi:type IV fimbrial biogenesis protein FimT
MRKLNHGTRSAHGRAEGGFTLVELMFGILLLSILMALAIPSFRQYTASTRTSAASNNLASAFAVARSEALTRTVNVSICGSNNQKTCIASPGTNWTGGWIAFTDNNGNGAVDPTDQFIQAWPAAGGNVAVTAGSAYVQYSARGMSNTGAVTFTVASAGCTGNKKSRIIVTASGSPQQSYIACP